ncbi:hypothetical protein D3C72_1766420 [compost metagenome]
MTEDHFQSNCLPYLSNDAYLLLVKNKQASTALARLKNGRLACKQPATEAIQIKACLICEATLKPFSNPIRLYLKRHLWEYQVCL